MFTYNLLDLKRTRWEGTEAWAPGKNTIEYDFKYDGLGEATLAYNSTSGVGRGGTGTLKVDGNVVSTQKLDASLPLVKPLDALVSAAPTRWMTATTRCRSTSLARSTR